MIETVVTADAPIPAGHYAQAIAYGDLIFVSGQLPIDPQYGAAVQETIEAQVEQALDNVEAILEQAGSDFAHVVKVTLYISDMALWGRVNEVYARRFGAHKPARAVVPVGPLHHGYQVEIEAIAVRGKHETAGS
jgi:2-iminobutanoate/2-iminopropanoate deaminase